MPVSPCTRSTATVSCFTGVRADLRQAAGEIVPEVRVLASELREVTGSLRRFSDQLEQNPGMLLYGKPASRPGPGE